jgi:AcrR family transcriptional regulator
MTDPRQERTRRTIFAALDELLIERPYDQINVTDLTLRAHIGRQTFYRHFDSIDAVVEERFRIELTDQRAFAIGTATEIGSSEWFFRVTRFAFQRVAALPRLSRIILRGEAGADALQIFHAQITDLWLGAPASPISAAPKDLHSYVASFHAGAITAVLLHWVDAGCSPDVETMSRFFTKLAMRARLD